MSQSVIAKLIIKDLYLFRWLIAGTTLAGLAAIALSAADGSLARLGEILFVTSIIVHGVIVALYGVMTERKSRSLLFVLSLPISPMQYTFAKVAGGMIAFLVPWTVLLAVIVALTGASALPFTLIMMMLFLANFAVLMAIGISADSELWPIIGIIVTNTTVPVVLGTLMPFLIGDGTQVWTTPLVVLLMIEVHVLLLAVGSIFLVQSRRRSFD